MNIATQLKKYHGRKIYVGFSGGADSTALLLLLHHAAEENDLTIEAVHFDHHLRIESGADAQWCKKFCEDSGISCRIIDLDVTQTRDGGETLEAAARRCRLESWGKIVEKGALIALGHHSGDRAENMLLRLCRGSNVTALTSMRSEQKIGGLLFIRPFLGFTRQEIEKYLEDNRILDWREDDSNRDIGFRRNYFRHEILPEIYRYLPAAEKGLQRSLEVLEQDADFIEAAASGILASWDISGGLDLNRFNRLHPALAIRILRYWLQRECGEDVIPERHLLERLATATDNGETIKVPIRGGWCLEIKNAMINLLNDEEPEQLPEVEWFWRSQPVLKYGKYRLRAEIFPAEEGRQATGINAAAFDAASLPEPLTVRSWRNGDQMVPFGKNGPVKLKKFFTDVKIAGEKRGTVPLLCLKNGTIIWIAGLRRSDFAVVNETDPAAVFYI